MTRSLSDPTRPLSDATPFFNQKMPPLSDPTRPLSDATPSFEQTTRALGQDAAAPVLPQLPGTSTGAWRASR